MKKTYQYGHRPIAKRRRSIVTVLVISVLIVIAVAFGIYQDLRHSNNTVTVEGKSQVIGQIVGSEGEGKLTINEATYSMELPIDWKELARTNTTTEHSVTWVSTKKNEEARWFKVYVDTIPSTKAVNRLLPVTVQGAGLATGIMSDNCVSFSGSGTIDATNNTQHNPVAAKWQGVDFICNVPGFVDNEVGVGAVGEPVNQVIISGAEKGQHSYFFLFTDRTIQPNYTILTDALASFQAK